MSVRKNVLVLGKSLSLAGITACLELDERLDVRFVDPHISQAKHNPDEFTPEIILFDLTNPPNNLDKILLQQSPGLLLIGVDPSSDEVLILKGERNRVVTVGELTELISKNIGKARVDKGL